MEFEENGFLDELLRRGTWDNFPSEMGEFNSNGGKFECFQDNPDLILPCSPSLGFSQPTEPFWGSPFSEVYCPLSAGFSAAEIDSSHKVPDIASFPGLKDCGSVMEGEELGSACDDLRYLAKLRICDVEFTGGLERQALDVGVGEGRKSRVKKVEGQPSKNLMAERRRRKRLNDRLSMLRSVVPKISKMDRTSILGDTIDYMKELLERIKNLQKETQVDPTQLNLLSVLKELKPNDILVRNSPKFAVERRNTDTLIEICCAAKPGTLLSTVNTLEALELEIQHCVISCFSDFGMQASCSEELEQRTIVTSEEIQQALFRGVGYGGRCM